MGFPLKPQQVKLLAGEQKATELCFHVVAFNITAFGPFKVRVLWQGQFFSRKCGEAMSALYLGVGLSDNRKMYRLAHIQTRAHTKRYAKTHQHTYTYKQTRRCQQTCTANARTKRIWGPPPRHRVIRFGSTYKPADEKEAALGFPLAEHDLSIACGVSTLLVPERAWYPI